MDDNLFLITTQRPTFTEVNNIVSENSGASVAAKTYGTY